MFRIWVSKSIDVIERFPLNLFRLEPKNLFFFFLLGTRGQRTDWGIYFPSVISYPSVTVLTSINILSLPLFCALFVARFMWTTSEQHIGISTADLGHLKNFMVWMICITQPEQWKNLQKKQKQNLWKNSKWVAFQDRSWKLKTHTFLGQNPSCV